MTPMSVERAAGVGSCSARKWRRMEGRGTGTRARLSVQATVMWLYIACVAVVEVRRGRRRRDAGSKERLNGVTRLFSATATTETMTDFGG